MIEITSGQEDQEAQDYGSDSGPSDDNLEDSELAQIVPLEPVQVPPVVKERPQIQIISTKKVVS